MADVLTYSDFWFLSLIPIILQCIAIGYLFMIRKLIGQKTFSILAIKNVALLGLYIGVTVALVEANNEKGVQPLESTGLYIDFIGPLIVSTMFMIHLRTLKLALYPNSNKAANNNQQQ